MKTEPWAPTLSTTPPLSAMELSLADTLWFQPNEGARTNTTLVAGVYTAVLYFRNKLPCELRSDRFPEPLIQYDGQTIRVLEAIRPFIADLEGVCTSESNQGVQDGIKWARANPELTPEPAAEPEAVAEPTPVVVPEPAPSRNQHNAPRRQPDPQGQTDRQSQQQRRPSQTA
jgi:hypothetical protein